MEEPNNQKPTYIHDAFISYSRKDKEFARKLDKALKDYKPPNDLNVPQRNLDVFRDEEDFTGVEYHESVARHLKDSAKLIVLCSPNSRKSEYVNDEIQRFAGARGADNIIPILVSGIPNNEAKPGQEGEMAFPDALCEAMEMPLAASYLGFDLQKDKVNKGIFYGPWYTILANLYGISRSEIEQREKKRQARRRNFTIGIVSGVISVLAVALVFALISRQEAVEQRKLAERQRNIAVSRQLAAQSELTRNQEGDLKLSVQLAAEAMRRLNSIDVHSLEVDLALRRTLALFPRYLARFELFNYVEAVTFSLDGRYLTAASTYLTTGVYEIKNHQEGKIMRGKGVVDHVTLSPEGKYLATADDDGARGAAQVLEAATLREVKSFKYEGHVQTIALSPDGKYLAIQFWGGDTSVWDVASGQEIGSLTESSGPSFSPDGKYLATKRGVWEVTGEKPVGLRNVKNFEERFHYANAFSPDGKYLATTMRDTLQVLDTTNWKEVENLEYDGGRLLALSLDGKYVAAAKAPSSYSVQVWDVESDKEVARIYYGGQVKAVAFSPSGQYLAIGGYGRHAELWEITGGSDIARIKLSDGVSDVAFGLDEEYVVMVDRTGTIINTHAGGVTNNQEVAILKQGQTAAAFAFSASGQYLAVSTNDGNVQVWDTSSAQKVENFKYDGVVKAIALSPDGKYLSIATDNGKVHVWKVTNPQEEMSFEYEGNPETLAVSPDGKSVTMIVGSGEHSRRGESLTAQLWKLPSMEKVRSYELGTPEMDINVYALSSDGRYLAMAMRNNTVNIRDLENDQIMATLSHGPNDLALSADGQYLAMVIGSTARVWEVAGGKEVARIESGYAVNELFFSPNARYLATVGQEGGDSENSTLKVWLLHPEDLIAEACSRLSDSLAEHEWRQYLGNEPYRPTCPNLQISKE